jgi:V/A-type H+-transporting ATPase subunit C
MSDYDYLNARVRGMSTTLLTRDFYEHALGAAGDNMLLDSLLASSYGEELQEALAARATDPPSSANGAGYVAAVEAAVRKNVHRTFARLLSIAPAGPRRLIALQLNRWDVANILALVRGRLTGASFAEVLSSVFPIGELDEVQLGELAAETDVRNLADALTTWKHAFAFALRAAIRECPREEDPAALEAALYRAYFQWALAQLRPDDPEESVLREILCRQIDLVNVLAALELVHDRERGTARETIEPIPRGKIPQRTLAELADCRTLEAAFETLVGTYFSPGIEKGILAYGQARTLAVMERFLETTIVEHGCRLFRLDMLSIAVPLGFIWRKYGELVNLRLLVRGAAYRMPANAIREGMVIV